MKRFLILLLMLFFTACASMPAKAPTYDTATLLFFSNDRRTMTGKFIKVPEEIPANFTELPYNDIFGWSEYICEIRFAESKDSDHFYSVFAFRNYSTVIALAKVRGTDKPTLFWLYNAKGEPIRISYEEFKKALNLPKDLPEKLEAEESIYT